MPPATAAPSYVSGTSERPLLYQSVGGVLQEGAARWPDQLALISRHQGIRWTYRELNERVDVIARGLLALGLQPGERIGIWSPNNAEWVLTQFAAARAGLILVNVNPAYRAYELDYVLRKVGCRALVLAPSFKASDYLGILRQLIPELATATGQRISSAAFPQLEFLIHLGSAPTPGYLRFSDLSQLAASVTQEALECVAIAVDPDEPTNIQFTSGTTGPPKGATLTHFNIVNNGYFVGEGIRLVPGDRIAVPVPLYHCFGMVMAVLGATTHGAAVVFPAESFEPESVLRAVAEDRCTALYGVPTMFIAQLEHPRFREFDLSSLRTGIMAGAPCPIAVMRRVVDEMHMREVTICYGMTETSPVSFQSSTEDSLEKRVSTVGRIHPHVQVKLIDRDGRVVPRGTKGELLTRGYSVMRGYWDDPEKTAESIDAGGWMHTGDLAVLDDEGFCNVVGRVKDMIIRGGENIYPRELEEYLIRHPKVLDVAVVGLPDRKYGEVVCAVVRLREGAVCEAREVIEFCRGQIAHYKVPSRVHFVDQFPLTVTGKVQKFLIREQLLRELRLEAEQTA
ncbi:MAG TPA: AMP-binding protein [Steroidobacteraceae bacterium]|nr:AMP-binding protein [Steroidobacteraceae bacterium]